MAKAQKSVSSRVAWVAGEDKRSGREVWPIVIQAGANHGGAWNTAHDLKKRGIAVLALIGDGCDELTKTFRTTSTYPAGGSGERTMPRMDELTRKRTLDI